jgi:pilus assembly protein Flp/PilA
MTRINQTIWKLRIWKDTSGQDLVEYALAAGLVAVAAVACMPSLSSTVSNVFHQDRLDYQYQRALIGAGLHLVCPITRKSYPS